MTIVPLVTKASQTEPPASKGGRNGTRIARLATGPATGREDIAAFRAALRHLAGGVSVITTGRGEDRTGLTATSVSSLSAEPPTLMFGLNLGSSSFPALVRHRSFAVNFLNAAQKQIADRFAGRGGEKGTARYAGASWVTGTTGAPLLDGALAALDCEVEELIERHSHAIVIGRVREIRIAGDDAALLYWRGDYERLGWMAEEASTALGLRSL